MSEGCSELDFWTEGEIATLHALVYRGIDSTSQIAYKLNRTKSAICGKCFKEGLVVSDYREKS